MRTLLRILPLPPALRAAWRHQGKDPAFPPCAACDTFEQCYAVDDGAARSLRPCLLQLAILYAALLIGFVLGVCATTQKLIPDTVLYDFQRIALDKVPCGTRIALVNSASFHVEVLVGAMHALKAHHHETTVYVHEVTMDSADFKVADHNRLMDHGLRYYIPSYWYLFHKLPRHAVEMRRHDVVIFLSAEFALRDVRRMIRYMQPRVVLAVVHEALQEHVQPLAALHPNVHLLAMAPHVVDAIQSLGFNATWWLPTMPFKPRPEHDCTSLGEGTPATSQKASNCSWGFTLQGQLDADRRNYTRLWAELYAYKAREATLLQQRQAAIPNPHLLVKLVGSDVPLYKPFTVPDNLTDIVALHKGLQFSEFYLELYRSHALLTDFSSPSYYTIKISSVLISGLVTGVPLLVEPRFASTYSFISPSCLIVQQANDTRVDLMLRVLSEPRSVHAHRRKGMRHLATTLNAKATAFLDDLLATHAARNGDASCWAHGAGH